MRKILEAKLDVQPAVTANGKIDIDGALSVLLHNAGTQTATINGHLTIRPDATLLIASPQADVVISDHLTVHFAAASGAKLEVVTTRLAAEAYSNYSNGTTH